MVGGTIGSTALFQRRDISVQEDDKQAAAAINSFLSTLPKTPTRPDLELDEVAIHFRCGDIMGDRLVGDRYQLLHFGEYVKRISNTTRTIGIVTQPFEKSRNRLKDSAYVDICRNATLLLADYLQGSYPEATTSIRNGPNETMATGYA